MQLKLAKKILIKWLPVLLWVAIICWLSFSSLDKVMVPKFFSADKIGHFGMYFILGFLINRAAYPLFNVFNLMILSAIGFAILTELIQNYFVENRQGEVFDFIANFIGILVVYTWKKKSYKS